MTAGSLTELNMAAMYDGDESMNEAHGAAVPEQMRDQDATPEAALGHSGRGPNAIEVEVPQSIVEDTSEAITVHVKPKDKELFSNFSEYQAAAKITEVLQGLEEHMAVLANARYCVHELREEYITSDQAKKKKMRGAYEVKVMGCKGKTRKQLEEMIGKATQQLEVYNYDNEELQVEMEITTKQLAGLTTKKMLADDRVEAVGKIAKTQQGGYSVLPKNQHGGH
jgi:hypothetical protein